MENKAHEANLILCITFGVYMAFQWLSARFIPDSLMIVHVILGQLCIVLPGIIWMCLRGEHPFKVLHLYWPDSKNVKMAIAVLACAYPVIVCINMLTLYFVENKVSGTMSEIMPFGYWVSLFVMALMPAFNEEFLCRGILYHGYRTQNKIGGVALSALIFGLFHLNLNQMPYALFAGVVFALMVEATGSLVTSMIIHMLLNGFNISLNFWLYAAVPRELTENTADTAFIYSQLSTSMLITALVIMAFFLFLLFIIIRKTFRINHRTMHSGQKSRLSLIDPLVLLFIAATCYLTILNTTFL